MLWVSDAKLPNVASIIYVYKGSLYIYSIKEIMEYGWNKWWKKPVGFLIRQNVPIKKTCGIYTENEHYFFVDKHRGEFVLFDCDPTNLTADQQERLDMLRRIVETFS